ncbi:MAG: nuclear transport factor 2 family protein [Anaerolineales bacterium]|nr:nuclear transport factor 2 family protein [Anaerolineales bacterium]
MPINSSLDAMTAATVTTIQQFNDALNGRDVEMMMALMAGDCVFENTYPAPDGTRLEGQARVRAFWEEFFAAAAKIELEIEEIFAVGERGVMRWVYRWTDREGQPGYVRGVDVYRMRNGQIAEKLSYVKG